MEPYVPLWALHSHRIKIALCLMFALFVATSSRTGLSMAIVCMVNSTAYAEEEFVDLPHYTEEEKQSVVHDGCPVSIDSEAITSVGYSGKLLWSPASQSLLFTATYYGSMLTIAISGFLADNIGPKRLMMATSGISMVVTLAAPTLANTQYWVYYASRVVLGMCEGFAKPCANAMIAVWFPLDEKSTIAALYTSGIQIATAFASIVGAYMCRLSFLDGWPTIFYLFGSLSLVWLIVFAVFASDSPMENKFISAQELAYLNERISVRKKSVTATPWSHLFTSSVILACIACSFANAFCVTIMQNYLPLYLKEELFLPISYNAFVTVVPFVMQLVCKNAFASIADRLKKSGRMSPTSTVKLFQTICSFGTGVVLCALAIMPSCHNPWIAVVLLFLYGSLFSCGISGFFTAQLSIAPAYTGTISSMSLTCGVIASLASSNFLTLLSHLGWPHKWQFLFFAAAALQILSGAVFIFYGSGEPAAWAGKDVRTVMKTVLQLEKDCEAVRDRSATESLLEDDHIKKVKLGNEE